MHKLQEVLWNIPLHSVSRHFQNLLFRCVREQGCHIDGYSKSARKPEVIHKSNLFFCFVDGFMSSKETLEAIEALISRCQFLCDCLSLTIGRRLVASTSPSELILQLSTVHHFINLHSSCNWKIIARRLSQLICSHDVQQELEMGSKS